MLEVTDVKVITNLLWAAESGADEETVATYMRCEWSDIEEMFEAYPAIKTDYYGKRAESKIRVLHSMLDESKSGARARYTPGVAWLKATQGNDGDAAWDIAGLEADAEAE